MSEQTKFTHVAFAIEDADQLAKLIGDLPTHAGAAIYILLQKGAPVTLKAEQASEQAPVKEELPTLIEE